MAYGAPASSPPLRLGTSLASALFGVFGAPLAWTCHLIATYALASHRCYPDGQPLESQGQGFPHLLLAIDLIALAIGLLATFVALRQWRTPSIATSDPLDVRQGRQRFLALCGLMTGTGFSLAIAIDVIAIFVVPLCGA